MSSPYEVSVHHFMERFAWTVYSFLLIPPYPMFFINEGAPRVLFGRENEVFVIINYCIMSYSTYPYYQDFNFFWHSMVFCLGHRDLLIPGEISNMH